MTHIVDAIYDHGVFRPTVPLSMPDGTRVQLRVEEEVSGADTIDRVNDDSPSLFERLKDVIGSIDDLPEDSSENLDHYLYGQPKR